MHPTPLPAVIEALVAHGGNLSATARALGWKSKRQVAQRVRVVQTSPVLVLEVRRAT